MTTMYLFCLAFWTIVIVSAGASLWLIPAVAVVLGLVCATVAGSR